MRAPKAIYSHGTAESPTGAWFLLPSGNRPFRDGHHIGRGRGWAWCAHDAGSFSGPPEGELVMMTMVTIALFAMALAFPGLITAVMTRTANA